MLQAKKFNFVLVISLSAFLSVYAQSNYCWDPSTGSQVNCVSPNNAFCVTNYTSGVGSCSETQPTDPSLLYCNNGDGCNQIVTQCYNPQARYGRKNSNSDSNSNEGSNLSGFVGCNPTGTDTYCVLSFAGPLLSPNQLKSATGSCSSSCTPTNTNALTVTFCCLGQNNCNNVFGFGGHHRGGHSVERSVKSAPRTGKAQKRASGKGRFAMDLE